MYFFTEQEEVFYGISLVAVQVEICVTFVDSEQMLVKVSMAHHQSNRATSVSIIVLVVK